MAKIRKKIRANKEKKNVRTDADISSHELQFLKKAMLQYYLKKSLVFLKKICCLFNVKAEK